MKYSLTGDLVEDKYNEMHSYTCTHAMNKDYFCNKDYKSNNMCWSNGKQMIQRKLEKRDVQQYLKDAASSINLLTDRQTAK